MIASKPDESRAKYKLEDLIDIGQFQSLQDKLNEIETGKLIKESEEQFRSIFELAPTGMLLLGLDGSFIKVNRAFCEMTGYSDAELGSMSFKEITHPEDLQESNEWVEKLIDGEVTSIDFEKRYIHKSGQIVWGSVRAMLRGSTFT